MSRSPLAASTPPLLWIGFRAALTGWLALLPVVAWTIASHSRSGDSIDVASDLTSIWASLAAAIAAHQGARGAHDGQPSSASRVAIATPARWPRWLLTTFARWAGAALTLHCALSALALLWTRSAQHLPAGATLLPADFDLLPWLARVATEALLLATVGAAATRIADRRASILALLLLLQSLWRAQQLYPATSSSRGATALLSDSPLGRPAEEASRATEWGSPVVAGVLLAASLLALWLATCTPPRRALTSP